MTLKSSGTLFLNNGGTGDDNIRNEVEGSPGSGTYLMSTAYANSNPSVVSPMSNFYGHTQGDPVINTPNALTADNSTPCAISELTWGDSTGITGETYRLEVNVNTGGWVLVTGASAIARGTQFWEDTTTIQGTGDSIVYRIKAQKSGWTDSAYDVADPIVVGSC